MAKHFENVFKECAMVKQSGNIRIVDNLGQTFGLLFVVRPDGCTYQGVCRFYGAGAHKEKTGTKNVVPFFHVPRAEIGARPYDTYLEAAVKPTPLAWTSKKLSGLQPGCRTASRRATYWTRVTPPLVVRY